MVIRFANKNDTLRVVRSIQNKGITYITPALLRHDIENGNLIIAEENGKILGSLSVVNEINHGYHAIKRCCIYNNKNRGKGIMSALFDFAIGLGYPTYGCTPWKENTIILHYMKKYDFQYQFTVHENYLVHVRTSSSI